MEKTKSRKIFGLFNGLDILIILVLLAAVAFGVYWVAGGKNNGGAAAETKTYTYVVEGRQVLNETANFPVEGGKVFDSTSSAYLGTVKSCRYPATAIFMWRLKAAEQKPIRTLP